MTLGPRDLVVSAEHNSDRLNRLNWATTESPLPWPPCWLVTHRVMRHVAPATRGDSRGVRGQVTARR